MFSSHLFNKKTILGLLLSLFFLATFGYFIIEKQERRALPPTEVIEQNFKYKNDHNKTGLLTTRTPRWRSIEELKFENERFNVLNIVEEIDPSRKNFYLQSDLGQYSSENNVLVYKVEYEVISLVEQQTLPKEIHTTWFYLVRNYESASWLIDTMSR